MFTRMTSVRRRALQQGFELYEGAQAGTYTYKRDTGTVAECDGFRVPRAQYVPINGSENEIARVVRDYMQLR